MELLANQLIIRSGDQIELIAPPVTTESGLTLEGFEPAAKNLWDEAHQLQRQNTALFVEPDIINQVDEGYPNLKSDPQEAFLEGYTPEENYCSKDVGFDTNWARPDHDEIWHLSDNYSQLGSARAEVAAILQGRTEKTVVRIAHFDTGYDPQHTTFPSGLVREDLQRNFSGEGNEYDARDLYGGMNKGHGCGTLSILAGKNYANNYGFQEHVGLSEEHGIEIVPIRIAGSVLLFRSRVFEHALEYVIGLYDDPDKRCHIISMSMGGAPTRNWAALVNKAYDKGIFIVTAAGNNYGGVTPRTLVYPARFNRVVAACGITQKKEPYYKFDFLPHLKIMQGNYGPRRVMRTAMAAYTPNVPWARFTCKDTVDLSGAGTSSATPQIAAAAALYYQKFYDVLEGAEKGWQRVEFIRHALFSSADGQQTDDPQLYIGRGAIRAKHMLAISPDVSLVNEEERDTVFLPILTLFAEIAFEEAHHESSENELEMYELELNQRILQSAELQKMLNDEEKTIVDLSPGERREFVNKVRQMPEASEALKTHLATIIK